MRKQSRCLENGIRPRLEWADGEVKIASVG